MVRLRGGFDKTESIDQRSNCVGTSATTDRSTIHIGWETRNDTMTGAIAPVIHEKEEEEGTSITTLENTWRS